MRSGQQAPTTWDFYEEVLSRLVREGVLAPETHRVLVVAGGERDQRAFQSLGFKQVTISNLDTRMTGTEYAPYAWSFQDAEDLRLPDGSFDFCVVHNGLHHCASPHHAIIEMLRVARRGVLLFEPYDNVLTRLGVRLGFGQDFEHAAVFGNDCLFGGVRNTPVPNYVYRFTRREILKTVMCGLPHGRTRVRFLHEVRIPWRQLKARTNRLFLVGAITAEPFLRLLVKFVPSWANCFAALILRPQVPQDLHPWLTCDSAGGIQVNRQWLNARYQTRQGSPRP
jgi:SAM-dependent methyltransferase